MWAKKVCSKMWGNLWLGVYGQIGGSNRDLGGLKNWRNPGKLNLWANSKRGFKGWPKVSLELYGQNRQPIWNLGVFKIGDFWGPSKMWAN